MRRSKQQTAETRQKIIQAASALFRERGVDGVSVAEVMEKAGLTHGGFYKHFESKDALLAEAIGAAFAESMCAWDDVLAQQDDKSLSVKALIDLYLTDIHKKDLAHGCPAAALASEMIRQDGSPKSCFADGVKGMIAVFEKQIAANNEAEEGKELAIATVASLIGALMIARSAENEKTAQSYLDAARKTLLGLLSAGTT